MLKGFEIRRKSNSYGNRSEVSIGTISDKEEDRKELAKSFLSCPTTNRDSREWEADVIEEERLNELSETDTAKLFNSGSFGLSFSHEILTPSEITEENNPKGEPEEAVILFDLPGLNVPKPKQKKSSCFGFLFKSKVVDDNSDKLDRIEM